MADDDADDRRHAANCDVIREYLKSEFVDAPDETPDPRRGGLIFRIPWVGLASLWFSDKFLEDTEPQDTAALLRRENISSWMPGVAKGHMLAVTGDGVKEVQEK